jgi:hypothetical protein
MSEPQKKEQPTSHDEVDLRGTLASVGFLGFFIILSWLGVWYLFISR